MLSHRRSRNSSISSSRKAQKKSSPVRNKNETSTVFSELLQKSGFKLSNGNESNELDVDQAVFQRNFIASLRRHPDYPDIKKDIISCLELYINDSQKFHYSLTSTCTSSSCTSARGAKQDSLIRLLLKIEELQPQIMNLLLEKLAICSEEEPIFESSKDITTAKLIMMQLKWLDRIVDSKAFCDKILEILSITNEDTQKEIINCLPEIIEDKNHLEVATGLSNLMDENKALAVPVLDALTHLHLSRDLLCEIQNSALKMVASIDLENLPVILKFILETVTADNATNVLGELRNNLDLTIISPNKLEKNKAKDCVILAVDAIKSSFNVQSFLSDSWMKIIENINVSKDFQEIDLIVLLILLQDSHQKNQVESLVKNKVRCGYLQSAFLESMFKKHSIILQEYFPSLLIMAGTMLKSLDQIVLQFGAVIYQCIFLVFDAYYQQEIVAALLTHIGSHETAETDTALNMLEELTCLSPKKMIPFAVLIKSILDSLDDFELSQIRKVYSILSVLAYKSTFDEGLALKDEMHIIIRKQLANDQLKYKRMGIIGALMAVKCLAPKMPSEEQFMDKSIMQNAIEMLELVQNNVKDTSQALALFYDELSTIILNKELHPDIEVWVNTMMVNSFQEEFVRDVENESSSNSDLKNAELLYGLDSLEYEDGIAINLLPMVVKETTKQIMSTDSSSLQKHLTPMVLAPLFRLLRICEDLQNDGSLEGIDALLGCPIYTVPKEQIEKFQSLSVKEKNIICTTTFYCLNWFREVINAFATQTDEDLRAKVIKRLQNIIEVEQTLCELLSNHPTFVPPPAIFDQDEFEKWKPPKNQVKSVKRKPKKQKTSPLSQVITNTQTTTIGTQLTSSTEKGKQKINDSESLMPVNILFYKQYFRELDLDVFSVLNGGLLLHVASEDLQNHKRTKLCPPELLFLLNDLNRKLERVLVASSHQSFGFRNKNNNTIGFSHILSLPPSHVAKTSTDLVPQLCIHLETISSYFQALIEESDGIIDGQAMKSKESIQLANCLQQILKTLKLIFSWNGFNSSEHRGLLKRALTSVSNRLSASGSSQRSYHDTIGQVFVYFENLIESTPNFVCAVAIVLLLDVICNKTEEENFRSRIVKMSESFLKRNWTNQDGGIERGAVFNENLRQVLLVFFGSNDDSALSSLESLCLVGLPELLKSKGKDSESSTYPTLNKHSFSTYYRMMLSSLNKVTKNIMALKTEPQERLLNWNLVVRIFHILVNSIKVFDNPTNIISCLRHSRMFVEIFLKEGMSLLELSFSTHIEDIHSLLKSFQQSTRYLQHMCSHSKVTKNVAMMNHVPLLKRSLEIVVYRVKAMLALNKCTDAFWLGNLKNRDLQGEEILSQVTRPSTPVSSEENAYNEEEEEMEVEANRQETDNEEDNNHQDASSDSESEGY